MPNLEDYSDMEIEANDDKTLPVRTAYGTFPRGYSVRRVHNILTAETLQALRESEPGMNYGVHWLNPINTLK